ncbi:DUF2254 domain-containing protein [Mariniflexile ostreae]|uniref:DUF2254 domain-containing protein n=1 Tax=Mariniflexile ostreae TaxID=1520892 RepID=A0ABV5FDF5_9FLAO
MKAILHRVLNYIYKLESNIAFYPSLISLGGFLFAFLMYYVEHLHVSKYLVEHVPWLVINNVETARTILTTFIAGLISIMVFSFSMVMILLNQASSNFSPRVLPGLISNRRHQVILGIYNSCLLYCIFTLISIEPTGDKYQLPGFSVLLAIVFMTFCLGAFIYFIHSISQEIQISNIMSVIFNTAKNRLNTLVEFEKTGESSFPNSAHWLVLKSKTSGYMEDVSLSAVFEAVKDHGVKVDIMVYKGEYVFKGNPLFRIERKIKSDAIDSIFSAFNFSKSEFIEDNYVLAFKQLTEIAVKAMSPGINDPGTAINAIDYLTELFLMRMRKKDKSYYFNASGVAIVHLKSTSFKVLLYEVMGALRTYCKHDIVIVQKLLGMFEHMLQHTDTAEESYKNMALREAENLYEDASSAISNKADLEGITKRLGILKHIAV